MPADVLRLLVFARHAESVANAANMLNSNPSQPVALTARGRTQARAQMFTQHAAPHVAGGRCCSPGRLRNREHREVQPQPTPHGGGPLGAG